MDCEDCRCDECEYWDEENEKCLVMNETISAVSMALYRIEQVREKAKEQKKLPIYSNDQLAILELNNEHDKAVELLERFQKEYDRIKEERDRLKAELELAIETKEKLQEILEEYAEAGL